MQENWGLSRLKSIVNGRQTDCFWFVAVQFFEFSDTIIAS
jgi:hypothetical protein